MMIATTYLTGLANISFGSLVQAQAALTSVPRASRAPGLPSLKGDSQRDAKNMKDDHKGLKRKRENKHAPMEMSSKKPVGRTREVVDTFKIERRDPRFDPDTTKDSNNTGHISGKYKFLEDYKKDEMRILQESIKKEKDPAARLKLEKTLGSMQSRLQAAKERERRQRVLSEYKNKERAAAKDGKIPFHLKAAEKNKLYLKDKFDSMKDTKGLDKFLEKKRKRRSQKDRKRALPA